MEDGYRVDPGGITAVASFAQETPKTVGEVRQTMGSPSYNASPFGIQIALLHGWSPGHQGSKIFVMQITLSFFRVQARSSCRTSRIPPFLPRIRLILRLRPVTSGRVKAKFSS